MPVKNRQYYNAWFSEQLLDPKNTFEDIYQASLVAGVLSLKMLSPDDRILFGHIQGMFQAILSGTLDMVYISARIAARSGATLLNYKQSVQDKKGQVVSSSADEFDLPVGAFVAPGSKAVN